MTHYMKTARKIVESRTQDTFGAIGCNLDLEHIATFFDETECDHSFQRKGGFEGGSGWTKERALAYMENMFKGCTFNKIMVADAKKCLEYAKECGDEKSIVYYQNVLDKGKKYVSIDGNNTASTIARYASNKLKVNKKYLTDHGDQGEQLRHLYAYRLDIVKLERILLDEMTELFRHLNTSTALNKQEYRQARISPLAEYVRNTANKPEVRETLRRLGVFRSIGSLDQRYHEEFVAQLLLHYVLPASKLTKPKLDAFYEDLSDVPPAEKQRLAANLDILVKIFADQKPVNEGVFSKGKFYSAMTVIDNLNSKGHNILNFNAFREWFIKRDLEWIAEDQTIVVSDQKEKSYSYWCKFYYGTHENARLNKKWNDCLDTHIPKLVRENILTVQTTAPRYYTVKEKLILCVKQDWKTRKGENISPSDAIAIKGGIHGDHMRSVKEGGETTLENGEVMFPVDNLKKSSKSNEPHFEHQR